MERGVLVTIALLMGLFLSPSSEPIPTEQANPAERSTVAQLEEEYGYIQHEIFLGEPDMPVLLVIEEDHANLAVQAEIRY